MASRIAGITVVLDGDATKLSNALKDVNKEIKTTQSQLKDVDKLLKVDPSNTELLTQKQKYLGDALTETKTKLESLKNVKLQNLDNLNDVQLDALNREIAETEAALKSLEAQGATTNSVLQGMNVVGTQMQQTGQQISNAGKSLMPVTLGVVAAGTAAVKTSQDFDSAMSQVAAVSGAAGDELYTLREKAIEMGAKTKFSASEAAEAMNYMAMAGWKTQDMLNGIEGVMNLAAASGEDLGTTSDIVTDALTAFNLTAADSGHFADILAAASSNANTNVSMMGETFKYAAPVAGALGYSAEDVAVAIGLMANSGIKASQAGTSLRTTLLKLQGEIGISGEKLGEVTIQTANADGSMRNLSDILYDCREAFSQLTESEAANQAEVLVGKNAVSGFLALMNAAPADIEKLDSAVMHCSDEMDGFNGTCEAMANTMLDNLGGDITILKSNLESLAIAFGDILVPVVREIVEHLQGLVTWLNSLDEGTKQTIVKIALFAAALGPVLIVVGKVISAVGTILTAIPKLITFLGKFPALFGKLKAAFAVLSANPIVLIIAAIAALVAAFIYLWNNCEGFRNFWINLWEKVKTAFMTAWESIKAFLSTAWEAIKTNAQVIWAAIVATLVTIWESIKTTCTETFETIKTKVTEIWENMKTSISEAVDNIWNAIKEGFGKAVDFIDGLISDAYNWGKNLIGNIVDGILSMIGNVKEACGKVWNSILDFLHIDHTEETTDAAENVTGAISSIAEDAQATEPLIASVMQTIEDDLQLNPELNVSDVVSSEWAAAETATTTSWTNISTFLTSTWNALSQLATTIWTNLTTLTLTTLALISTVMITTWTNLNTFITTTLMYILTLYTTVHTQLLQITITMWTQIYSGIATAMQAIVSTIVSGFASAVSYIQSLITEAYNWGYDLIGRIVQGMEARMSSVHATCNKVAKTIKSYLHFSLPDTGPLRELPKWMPDMMKQLAEGIEGNRKYVKGAIANVASDMALSPQISMADAIGGAISAKSSMLHSGTIRVEGINDKGALSDVVDIIIDQLRREVRA